MDDEAQDLEATLIGKKYIVRDRKSQADILKKEDGECRFQNNYFKLQHLADRIFGQLEDVKALVDDKHRHLVTTIDNEEQCHSYVVYDCSLFRRLDKENLYFLNGRVITPSGLGIFQFFYGKAGYGFGDRGGVIEFTCHEIHPIIKNISDTLLSKPYFTERIVFT